MLGALAAAALYEPFGLTPQTGTAGLVLGLGAILILAMLTSGSLNVMIERVAYRPLRSAPKLAPLITAVGMSFILQNVGILWIGASQKAIPDLLGSQKHLFDIWGVTVTRGHLLAIAVTIPLVILLTSFVSQQPAGQGDASHRAGPGGGAPDGHQRRHDDLADVPARRPDGRRRRADQRPLPDLDLVLPGLLGRPLRLHGRRHGRHRQHPRGRARRGDHRDHPGHLRQPHRQRLDAGDRLRLPRDHHGLPARRA